LTYFLSLLFQSAHFQMTTTLSRDIESITLSDKVLEELRALQKSHAQGNEVAGSLDVDESTGQAIAFTIQNDGTHHDRVHIPEGCHVCFHTHPDNKWNYPSPASGSDLLITAMRRNIQCIVGAEGIWIYQYKYSADKIPNLRATNPVMEIFLRTPIHQPATLDAFLSNVMRNNSESMDCYMKIVKKIGFSVKFVPFA
jgi:hypothetical protein